MSENTPGSVTLVATGLVKLHGREARIYVDSWYDNGEGRESKQATDVAISKPEDVAKVKQYLGSVVTVVGQVNYVTNGFPYTNDIQLHIKNITCTFVGYPMESKDD